MVIVAQAARQIIWVGLQVNHLASIMQRLPIRLAKHNATTC
jgi:hypothetical protein